MPGGVKSLGQLWDALLGWVYPESCPECAGPMQGGKGNSSEAVPGNPLFCAACWGAIRRLEGARCPCCAEPFPSEWATRHSPGHLCGECRAKPPAFSRAITPYAYEGALAKALQQLKYRQKNSLVQSLASLLWEDLREISVDWVMAIPLHPKRLRAREFNQSLLLARAVARHFRLPLGIDLMRRIRETPPQVGLSKKDRKKNVHRAFALATPKAIKGRRILLIDDVYTTGATLKEGAKTLKKAGAQDIIVATVARMVL